MLAPRYIQQELRTIDSLYFGVFNPKIKHGKSMSYGRGRWQIRKWTGTIPKRLDLWSCLGYSEVIFTLCQEEMTDMGLVDVGYRDIDIRCVEAIRRSNYWKAGWKKKLAEIDWRNEINEKQAKAELEYESRYVAKRIYRYLHEPTITLSGKQWKV